MRRVDFYQLTRDPAPMVVAVLAERILAQGDAATEGEGDPRRLLIVAADRRLRDAIDHDLWAHRPDGFLPHGDAALAVAADDPILIAETLSPAPAPNRAGVLALADGAWRDEAAGYDRILLLFDAAGTAAARDCWRALKAHADAPMLRYWRQDAQNRWDEGP